MAREATRAPLTGDVQRELAIAWHAGTPASALALRAGRDKLAEMVPLRLSPLDVSLEAGARLGQRRAAWASCGVPLAATLLASGAGSLASGGAQAALQLTSVAFLALTATHVHRLLALAQPVQGGVSVRLWLRYVTWLLTLVIALAISVTAPLSFFAEQAWSGGAPSEARLNAFLALGFVIVAAGVYLSARLCLVLPAVALQRTDELRLAWRHSRGNAAALAVLLMLPERLQWLVARALGEGTAGKLLSTTLEALALLAIAALLSVAWSRLAEPEPLAATSRGTLADLLPARWATLLLALPILLSHAWTQAQAHRELLEQRGATAQVERAAQAGERRLTASRAVREGDGARGLQLYREALELYRAAGSPEEEARTLVHIAELERQLGDEPAARDALEQALERARAAGETGLEALVQKALAAPRPAP